MLSGRKLEFWEIPSEFSQMDPSSLLRSYRKTEGFLGLNCLKWGRTLGEAQLWGSGVVEKFWKPRFRVSQEWTL